MSLALSRLPASQFSGLSGAESDMRAMIAWHTDCKVHAGLHAVFKISKQISPVCRQLTVLIANDNLHHAALPQTNSDVLP